MKRRQVIIGAGAAMTGGSALIGSGAFSSVLAERDISVAVADDADSYLRLAACTDEDGNPKPNGDYVYQGDDGLFSISLSGDNGNNPPAGSGVNPEALSKFHNVFEICNQGTQSVCVNFGVDDESEVPLIPSNADVPDRYDFEAGEDPAVIFYESDTEEPVFPVEGSDPNDGFELDVGECACFGFNVRAFGFDSGEDIFAGTDLTIIADAEAECGEEVPPEPEPEPDPFYGVDRNNNLVEITPDGDGNVAEEDLANLGSTSGNENYPNGLAYDESNEDWYYAEEDGEVFVLDDLNDLPESGEDLGDGTIAGATYFDDDYVYIPQGTNELRKASVDGSDSDKITDLDEVGDVNLGDLAVAFDFSIEAPVIYGSAVTSNEGAAFFKVELIPGQEADHFIISDGDDGADNAALGKQIAFVNGELVATKTVDSPNFRKVDLETGELGDSIGLSEREYTDLAQTEVPNIPTDDEDEEDDDGLPETGFRAISFVAFRGTDGSLSTSGVTIDDVLSVDGDGDPTEVVWSADSEVEEIVVKAGQGWFRFDVGGDTDGTVVSDPDTDGEDTADAYKNLQGGSQTFVFDDDEETEFERCPSSPFLGLEGVKIDHDSGFEFDEPEGTSSDC